MRGQKETVKPTPESVAAFEEVRDLLKDVDLTTAEGAEYALRLLRERNLPEFLVYGAKRAPITEELMRKAERRLAELRASGDVP